VISELRASSERLIIFKKRNCCLIFLVALVLECINNAITLANEQLYLKQLYLKRFLLKEITTLFDVNGTCKLASR
jgi:hypothetical protein